MHRGYAYIGQTFSNGFTILDVRDARHPKFVDFIACPPNTRTVHLQVHDDVLLAANMPSVWTMQEFQNQQDYFGASPADKLTGRAGASPPGFALRHLPWRPAARDRFLPVEGIGPHRIWYTGGRYAYASIHFAEFTDHIFAVVDVADPRKPEVVGRWWIPGMWRAGRRDPDVAQRPALRAASRAGGRHARVRRLARRRPHRARRRPIRRSPGCSPIETGIPVRRRHAFPAPVAGSQLARRRRRSHEPETAVRACATCGSSTFASRATPSASPRVPTPSETDYCTKGGNFGPHNLHENRPGSFQSSRLVFATYYNAGVRVFDIANPFQPREVAYYVPANPERMIDPRPGRPQVIQSADCYVDPNGLMYLTDSNARPQHPAVRGLLSASAPGGQAMRRPRILIALGVLLVAAATWRRWGRPRTW